MWKIKVLILIFAIVNVANATLGSDLDDDDFRRLKVESDEESDERQSDLNDGPEEQNDEEGARTFYNKGLMRILKDLIEV